MTKRYLTLKEMVDIQDQLNEHTVTNWRKTLNANDFKTAMFDELSELLNSSHWKWWSNKKVEVDYWNLKVEAIDILHFALSIYIMQNTAKPSEDLILGMYNTTNNYMINDGMIDRNVFINKACAVLTNNNPVAIDDLFNSLGLLAEEVSAIYTAKSELNFIRQDQGYKDGTYVKIQDGIEDNVKLEEVVRHFLFDTVLTLDELRQNVRGTFYEQAEKEETQEENHY